MLICVCVSPAEYQFLENRTLVLSSECVMGTGGLRKIEGGEKTTHMQGGEENGDWRAQSCSLLPFVVRVLGTSYLFCNMERVPIAFMT